MSPPFRPLALLSLGALLLLSCEATAPLAPPDGVLFTPAPHFRSLWRTVENCSGTTGDFAAVTWYSTDGPAGAAGTADVAGSWWSDGNRIYISEPFLADENVIRHEMLHAILRGRSHSSAFLGACGELVTCVGECIEQAGGLGSLPGPSSPAVAPSELDVQITVLPPLPGEGGWMTVVIAARNARDEPVWVSLSDRPGIQFECLLDSFQCGTHQVGGDSRVAFRAGATKREAFVFPALSGSYEVSGGFNSNLATPRPLVVP